MYLLAQFAPIPYARPDVSQDDIDAIVDVLRSGWLTQGPAIQRFEQMVATYTGAAHAVAVCNATAALHLACRALGVSTRDRLWTVPNTFVASANCGLYCGAEVDFVDIDQETYNISLAALADKLVSAKSAGTLPKVVVAVHFSGQPCDMKAIAELAREYKFRVIEDASHALGGTCQGEKIGSGRYSDITIFSFHAIKIITTGEGGMALAGDNELAERLALLRTHGITREASQMRTEKEGGWYYEQVELGYNYRMTDIQAALGASQMTRIDQFVARRREIAARYDKAFATLPVVTPKQSHFGESARHLYVIQIKDESGKTRKQVFDHLRAAGVLVNVHYIPVHLQPYYRAMGFKRGDFPVSERYYEHCISLPMYAALSDQQQESVIAAVREALR